MKKENQTERNHNNSQSTNIEEKFSKAIKILDKYKRKAYLPKIVKNENSFSTRSKIGGFPYLRNKTDWPICPNCKKNMQLFLQLNLEDLPKKKDNGLVQLFYCTTSKPLCESDMAAFFPFGKSVNCRKIEINSEPNEVNPIIDRTFEEKIIVDWETVDDYPHFEEYSKLGIELDLDDDVYELMEQREIGIPIEKDKLYGWPYWVQSVEYPRDRKTGTVMELLFQLVSEDNLPYMFGDAGIGHLTESPDNQNELGFGWACS